MTCIIAVKNKKGKLMFASDRQSTIDDSLKTKCVRPKINKRNGLIFGASGASFACDILVEIVPTILSDISETACHFNYMHREVVQSIITALADLGFNLTNLPKEFNTVALVAVKNNLYRVGVSVDEGIFVEPVEAPHAVGSGGLAAMAILRYKNKTHYTKNDLKRIIQVVSTIDPFVDDHCDILVED